MIKEQENKRNNGNLTRNGTNYSLLLPCKFLLFPIFPSFSFPSYFLLPVSPLFLLIVTERKGHLRREKVFHYDD